MKHSINKIFTNLGIYLLFVLLFATLALLLVAEQNLSVKKIDNLNNQKKIVSTLIKLQKEDLELALIQFNGKSTQLIFETEKLRNLYEYDFTQQYIFNNSDEYNADLTKLTLLTKLFNSSADEYYIEYTQERESIKAEAINKKNLLDAYYTINEHIDTMMIKDIGYANEKFYFIEKIVIFFFLVILISSLWFRNRLSHIYKDILFLYSVEKGKKNYDIFSEEVDAISLRMKRKTVITDNPAMIDQVTGINNNKGLVSSYSEKKGMKDSNFTSITVIEIDDFSKSNRAFSQELTQAILKKVAFTISLHEQATDVIARTDYNQFTIVLSRASKEQSYKDIEILRQSINELKFNVPNKGTTNITVSGGFIVKPNNTHLEEALRNAKEILKFAQKNGKNRIAQTRDVAQSEL